MIEAPIGGYFELELPRGSEYHPDAIKLNSGRHCLEYILRLRQYSKIWIPYYTCESVLQPIEKLGLDYGFYHIDENLEPIFPLDDLPPDEGLVYTNYFGLKDKYVQSLPKLPNLVIDNCQSFFSKPLPWFDTFYSPRKFFGVPDGGYLFTRGDALLDMDIPQACSYERCTHLLKRIDLSAEEGYADFKGNDKKIAGDQISRMSKLTGRILSSIDYGAADSTRVRNFRLYQEELGKDNLLQSKVLDSVDKGPLVYPFLTNQNGLREHLISRKIYVARYWPNVLSGCESDSLEYKLAMYVVPLPLDQRMNEEHTEKVISEIKSWRFI